MEDDRGHKTQPLRAQPRPEPRGVWPAAPSVRLSPSGTRGGRRSLEQGAGSGDSPRAAGRPRLQSEHPLSCLGPAWPVLSA